jgi:hypothetical protein
MTKDEMKNKISMALKDPILQQGFEIICKENAELKEQKEMLEKGYVWHDYDAGEDCYEDTHEGKWVKRDEVYQLTKAKEIISELLRSCFGYNSKTVNYEVKSKAEQFLKECK